MKRNNKPNTKKPGTAQSLLVLVFLAAAIYFTWRLFFTLPFTHGPLSIVFGVILLVAEGLGMLETLYHMYNIRKVKIPLKPDIPDDMYPHVDVLIATHNESTELLYKTVNGCLHMDYPEKDKVHIYLCDDGDRAEVATLASEMGVGYFGLSENQHAKAGNLNNALRQTSSPLVATLDADMIPTSAFLMETVPFFSLPDMILDGGAWRRRTEAERCGQKEIGFVQTPQCFYNEDLFQMNLYVDKNIPNEQDYFFREVNVGRTRSNTVIYCGSNTLLSRKALKEVGYIATGSITEDFATGMNIQALGYQSIAIDKELVHGLSPTDIKSLFKQRQRWARGCVQALTGRKFLFGPLPLSSKISYIMTLLHWWSFTMHIVFIAIPILTVLLGIAVAEATLPMLLLFWLPYYLLHNRAVRTMSGNARTTRWNSIILTVMAPYLVIPMILETFGIRKKEFFVTPKTKSSNKNATLRYAIPHIILAVLSVAALSILTAGFTAWVPVSGIIVAFWLVINLYSLLCAIAFYVGRINYRKDERIFASIPITIYPRGAKLHGVTADVSESGMAILLDAPEYLPSDHSFPVQLEYSKYEAQMQVQVVHVQQTGTKWKYSLRITELAEDDKAAYTQMIYDRKHTLTGKMRSNLFTDAWVLLKGLVRRSRRVIHPLPHIPLKVRVKAFASGLQEKVEVVHFTYKSLSLKNEKPLPESLSIELAPGMLVHCSLDQDAGDAELQQYNVVQWRELAEGFRLRPALLGMIGIPETANGYAAA